MKPIKYHKALKPDSFIHRYLMANEDYEAPYAFDFWAAIWLIGNACGRNCIVNRPGAQVYLNWYVVYVAESAQSRKSSAVKRAEKLYRRAFPNDMIIGSRTTPEMLEGLLATETKEHGTANARIIISEMVRFFGRETYNAGMPGLLTDLYDCPESRSGGGTLTHGTYDMQQVFLSVLTASTATWLGNNINPNIIEGGFTSRCIFVITERRKKRIPWPEADKEMIAIREGLADELQTIRDTANTLGQVSISDPAKRAFGNWYSTKKESHDGFRVSFEGREDDHVLRLAAIIAISEDIWVIELAHIRLAIRIISEVKENAASLFIGGMYDDKLHTALVLVRKSLLQAGNYGLSQTQVYNGVRGYLNREQINLLLGIMHEVKMISKFDEIRRGPGRPVTWWKAMQPLAHKDAVPDVMKRHAQIMIGE